MLKEKNKKIKIFLNNNEIIKLKNNIDFKNEIVEYNMNFFKNFISLFEKEKYFFTVETESGFEFKNKNNGNYFFLDFENIKRLLNKKVVVLEKYYYYTIFGKKVEE